MNNNLLDSTKKAGMHIFKYTYLLLMMPGSKRAIYSALLAAIFTLLHRFAIVFLVSSLYSNTSSFGYPERGI